MDPFGSQLFSGSGVLGTLSAVMVVAAEVDDPGGDASKRLSMAILGLLVLAGLILAATIVYWRMTRPETATVEATGMRWVEPVGANADLGPAVEDATVTPPTIAAPAPAVSPAPTSSPAPPVAPAPSHSPAPASSATSGPLPSPVGSSPATNPPLATRPTVARPAARPPAPGTDAVAG